MCRVQVNLFISNEIHHDLKNCMYIIHKPMGMEWKHVSAAAVVHVFSDRWIEQ